MILETDRRTYRLPDMQTNRQLKPFWEHYTIASNNVILPLALNDVISFPRSGVSPTLTGGVRLAGNI